MGRRLARASRDGIVTAAVSFTAELAALATLHAGAGAALSGSGG